MSGVPAGLYWRTRLVDATRGFWRRLGRFESSILEDDLEAVKIDRPIYVTALARSGTTIITEMLNEHPAVTSLRYADFPFTYTPYWRNWLAERTRFATPEPAERAHKDRIKITNDSPEAIEEVLWMDFFGAAHEAAQDQRLTSDSPANQAFDDYYQSFIKKLLLVRDRQRYLAKGNYNITRTGYIQRLFPDARFIIPIRNPVNHIASLAKQHRLFVEQQREDPRVRWQLGQSGHFEFGLDRTPIHTGDDEAVTKIIELWGSAETELEGWARYWTLIHQHILTIADDPNVLIVAYERLCEESEATIQALLGHCELATDGFEEAIARYSERLSPPTYYQPPFAEDQLAMISDLTADPWQALLDRASAS